jgi:fermentation-respiration switch protein FrsA (DUF1100 family)
LEIMTLSITGERSLRQLSWPSLVLLAGGAGAYLRNRLQSYHLFAPQRYPHGIWEPATYGLEAQDVWFETDDGVRLHAWWVPRKKARGSVLYCHGNNGNISTRIEALQQLHRLGLNVLAFDYRGYGRSEGSPSEEGLYRDVRGAYRHLAEELGQPGRSILLFGHSLGGAVAIDAAQSLEVAGLIVQSSFTHVRGMARSLFPRSPMFLIARNQFRSLDKIPHIEGPKLFIHGTDDPTVPVEMGREMFERANGPKEWFEVPRGGHNDLFRQGGWRYFRRLQRFCRQCLS